MTSAPAPFDDETLSAIIDGLADPETVAAVQADPGARARLARLRTVRDLVASPPAPATPERRAQSIAAALATAEPAPAVSSLAAARHVKEQRSRSFNMRWAAVAAAVLLFLVVVPFLATRGGDADVTATADDSSTRSLNADAPASADAGGGVDEAAGGTAIEESDGDAEMAESAPATTTTMAAMADAAEPTDDGADAAETGDLLRSRFASTAQLIAQLDGTFFAPQYTVDDPVLLDAVAPECLEPFATIVGPAFELADIEPPSGEVQTVVIVFHDDGTTTVLDAGDCSPVG